MSATADRGAQLRLWQLISPALPIGAYAYSAGLEAAVANDWVTDEDSAGDWIVGVMRHGLARLDLPLLHRFHDGWRGGDIDAVDRWCGFLRAARESDELAREDRHLGVALARVLHGLGMAEAEPWLHRADSNYPCVFALAAVRWNIECEDAAHGYLWAWCENQVTAALKLLPIGQSAGQRMLVRAAAAIGSAVATAFACSDDDVGLQLPGFALASALHETQYSRLFRS